MKTDAILRTRHCLAILFGASCSIWRRVILALVFVPSCLAQQGWWMQEPIRWIQTNLRETDAALDPQRLVDQLVDFRANVLLIGMGGIVAYYPTRVEFHYPSPHLPAGRDTFGDVLRLAHARGIRVIGRFDLSKTRKEVFDAHPDWFFRRENGSPVTYNGLYSVCINGGYYRLKAMEVLTEALERYDVDGLFFNMFTNPSTDYSGRSLGICQCESCKRLFRARFRRDLPTEPNRDYQVFLYDSRAEAARRIADLIHSKRPKAGFFTYISEYTDGIMSESNTAVTRPLPLWPYTSSDNVNRARNSQPTKMAVNLCMSFIDFPWRFATVPPREISIRLWQNVSHGGALAMNMHGTMDQQDRQALDAARPVFNWLARNERYFVGLESAARVLLLGRPSQGAPGGHNSYRGMFRLLSEEHIPFAVADNLGWMGNRVFDLVIATNWAPAELDRYVRDGGRLLMSYPAPPPMNLGPVLDHWKAVQGYLRIRDHSLFPSLRRTDLIMLNGEYLELKAEPILTLVPPSMFGPPELVHVDMKDTDKPGLILQDYGKGKVAYIPWDASGLYYLHSLPAHRGLMRDLVDHLLPHGRQVKTNAHPLVEMTLMRQKDRHLMHFINLSGHSQTAYFDAIPMSDIEVKVRGEFRSARLVGSGKDLSVSREAGYAHFVLPRLEQYELVELY